MSEAHEELYLVDTLAQLKHPQLIEGARQTIPEYAERLNEVGTPCHLRVLSATDFGESRLRLDVIYSIATFDVLPRDTRLEMIDAAARNLRRRGLYLLIVPRNDSSILKRCTAENVYQDGHVFERNRAQTFYCNYRKTQSLIDLVSSAGFTLREDLSIYRQVVLLFGRQ